MPSTRKGKRTSDKKSRLNTKMRLYKVDIIVRTCNHLSKQHTTISKQKWLLSSTMDSPQKDLILHSISSFAAFSSFCFYIDIEMEKDLVQKLKRLLIGSEVLPYYYQVQTLANLETLDDSWKDWAFPIFWSRTAWFITTLKNFSFSVFRRMFSSSVA